MGPEYFTKEELGMLMSAAAAKVAHWNGEASKGSLGGDPFARDAHNAYDDLEGKLLRAYQRACRSESSPPAGPPYTKEQVTEAVNNGVNVIRDALDLSEPFEDLLNLAVNAIVTVLETPDAALDQVIEANYAESPEEVLGWWDGWS